MAAVNRAYAEGLADVLAGWLASHAGDDLQVQLLSADYEWDPADSVSDLTGELGAATDIAGTLSIVDGWLVTSTDTTSVPSVSAGPDDVVAVAILWDGGPLVGYLAVNLGRVPIVVVTDGGDVDITWPDGRILSLGG